MIKCANRTHGWPPHVYHHTVQDVRDCCAGRKVANLRPDGSAMQQRAPGGVLGRRGDAWRAYVEKAWRQYVIDWEYFDGDIDAARDNKIRFFRRHWILPRDIDMDQLW